MTSSGPADHDAHAAQSPVEISDDEEADVREQVPHRAPVFFEIIRRNGQDEIERPLQSLWWSGLVAGLSIGFSLLVPAMLRRYLPDEEWASIIAQLGYSAGFVIVILSRQQLFTENVITAVVPVIARPNGRNLLLMARLWSVVLVANVCGTILFALFLKYSGAIDDDLARAVGTVSEHAFEGTSGAIVGRAMVSGFLIASLVWIMAGIEGSRLAIIVGMTYLIALGNFDHIVAGSVEAAWLVVDGQRTIGEAIGHFFVPTLIGNVVGGTLIFTLLAYGQIRGELKDDRAADAPSDDGRR